MSTPLIRVVKVGGSLLDLSDLGNRLSNWIDRQPPVCNLLIAGGGQGVDQLREQHATNPLDERSAHWRCIELMTGTAELLAGILPRIEVLDSLPVYDCISTAIFSPAQWLREVEPHLPGVRLRESWDVTSDSIAARVAICLDADELVLLKSTDAPSGDFRSLAECNFVDRMFPELAEKLPSVRIVNLRQSPCDALRRG